MFEWNTVARETRAVYDTVYGQRCRR